MSDIIGVYSGGEFGPQLISLKIDSPLLP